MGFGGSVSAMIASLKANKRARVSTFDKIKKLKKSKKSALHFEKNATPIDLKKIREKVLKENNTVFKTKVIILITLLIVILICLNYKN